MALLGDLTHAQPQTLAAPQASRTAAQPALQSSPINIVLIPDGKPLPPARRLVVLIPDLDSDETQLAQRIWALASPRELEVLFLGLCRSPYEESRARRRLATLAAITRDARTPVQTQLVISRDWIEVVRSVWRSGDLVVCHAEQCIRSWIFRRRALSHSLLSAINAPVYTMSGFYPEWSSNENTPVPPLITNAIPVVIIGGFLGLQILIPNGSKGAAYTVLMSASVIAEYTLIALWNHFFNS